MKLYNAVFSVILLLLGGSSWATSPTRVVGDQAVTNSVAVGQSTAANSKSVLELVSTTKGLLHARLTTTQRDAITSPPEGLQIENTTTHTLDWYNGSAWKQVASLADITTASTSTNASFFPLFVASSSNSVQTFNLGTGLTFNPSTNTLSTTTFVGALTGNASTATTATNSTNAATTATNSTNASFFLTFVGSSSSGNQGIDTATGLSFNPSTNTLTTTTFSGALSGNATTATTATNATNTAITDDTTTNATMYPTWVTTASGNQAQKVSSTKMTWNPSTGLFVAPGHQVSGQTASTVPYLDASKNITSSSVTPTELGYVSGVTSAIQTQINALSASSTTGQSYALAGCGLKASISSSTVVINLTQADGSTDPSGGSPCSAVMRSATATTGGFTTTSFTAATTITVGTTAGLGHTSLTGANIYVYLIADTTPELCVSNSPYLADYTVHSATATPATTGGTLYCTNTHTSRPTRLLGRIKATWSNPNWSSITNVDLVPFQRFDEDEMYALYNWQGSHTYVNSETLRFDTLEQDNLSAFSTSSWTYTVQIPSFCKAVTNAQPGSLDGVTDASISMTVCGSSRQCYGSRVASNTASNATIPSCEWSRKCAVGDTISATISGDASYVTDSNGNRTKISVVCTPVPQ